MKLRSPLPLRGTEDVDSNPRGHIWFGVFLAFVTVCTSFLQSKLTRELHPYIVGDWLISYAGGFVRRGLTGAVALPLSHLTNVPPQWLVFALQISALLVLMMCLYSLTSGLSWTPLLAALLLSPAALSFTVVCYGAGLRKETLLFAALALFLSMAELVSADGFFRRDVVLSLTLTLLLTAIVLIHEGLIVCAPYFVAALLVTFKDWKRAVRICLLPVLCSGAALLAVGHYSGNQQVSLAVCHALGLPLPPLDQVPGNLCSGAINWLQFSTSQARAEYMPVVLRFHFLRYFTLFAAVSFAPVILALALHRQTAVRREVNLVLACAMPSLAATLGLCFISLDWGRWIHMQVMCLTLLTVLVYRRMPRKPAPRQWLRRWIDWAVATLYITSWTLPDVYPDRTFGYLHIATTLTHALLRRHPHLALATT